MTAKEVLATLQKLGKPSTVKTYVRHGVTGPCWGVSYADIKPLVKKLGRDQQLAMELWKSGVHDARIVATMIADPEVMTRKQLEGWIAECGSYAVSDAVSSVAAQLPHATAIAREWRASDVEWVATAGWNVISIMAGKGLAAEADVAGLLEQIEKQIHTERNRVRYAMNLTLIAIGSYIPPLTMKALAAADRIGPVYVDHGDTSCETPLAGPYIQKVLKRNSGRVTGYTVIAGAGAAKKKASAKKPAAKKAKKATARA